MGRDQELAQYLDRLRNWALTQLAKLWSQMDREDLRGSWTRVYPALVDVHRVTCMRALDAVDDWMTLVAADRGFQYLVEWRTDRPGRPAQLPSGADAATTIARVLPAVLWAVAATSDVAEALALGHRRLATIIGSEPHDIWRTVSHDRVTR